MLPSTTERVRVNTADEINRAIREQVEARVHYFAMRPDEIDVRLHELDREWDIERALEANAGAITLASTLLGLRGNRFFRLLPIAVGGFLFQHALQGWCPPVPVLRRLGFRTASEIETERVALKHLRGDFKADGDATGGDPAARARAALAAARNVGEESRHAGLRGGSIPAGT